MEKRDQEIPLAISNQRVNDHEDPPSREIKKTRRRRWVKICGFICVPLLVLAIVITVLALTVFRVKDPTIKLNSITIDGWSSVIWSDLRSGMNLTIITDMSLKNPNAASFKFNSASTSASYDKVVIGEVYTPPGNARARRTFRMNATVEAMLDRIVGIPRLANDLRLGVLPMSTYTRMRGKVKVLFIKKSIGVKMRCDMSLNIVNQEVQGLSCGTSFSL